MNIILIKAPIMLLFIYQFPKNNIESKINNETPLLNDEKKQYHKNNNFNFCNYFANPTKSIDTKKLIVNQ